MVTQVTVAAGASETYRQMVELLRTLDELELLGFIKSNDGQEEYLNTFNGCIRYRPIRRYCLTGKKL